MAQADLQQILEAPKGQVGHRIFRATGALMIIQIVLRGFGLIEKSILGYLFGTDYRTDAYNAAKDIAFYLFQMVDQVIMHSFLPVFVQRMRDKDEPSAWRLASTTINFLVIVMAIVALAGMLFTGQILPVFLPDWFSGSREVHANLVPLLLSLTRLMLVSVIFLASSSLTYCLLNSYKKFALPASADLALKGTVLVFAIIFARSWGPYALAIGFVVGAIAKLIVHGIGLRQHVLLYRPVVDLRDAGFKRFAWLALPLLVGVFVSIVRQVMDQRFTSSLSEGSLSALKYAKNLCDVPVSFFPFAFGIALFPFLADMAAAGDRDRLRSMLMSATRMMILIFVPLTIFLIMLREPIVLTIFSSKSLLTTRPLPFYALGMLVGALEIIVLQFYFAMSDTLRPTVVGILMVPLHVGFAYLATYHWQLGILGIALALLISKGTKVVVLYTMIRQKFGTLEGQRTIKLVGQVVLALIPLVLALWAAVAFLPEPGGVEGKLKKMLVLLPYGLAGFAGFVAYFTILHLLKVAEVTMLIEKVRGKAGRKVTTG